ncbi:MAG: helix-turn-helix transcriptional regulator [Bacteroidales bacterium]|nr:helix-turn-helix transcriptional regulator [Bacteroidales bacterium]
MTVKEIFELRRQGRIEEAYDAIRPMYAVHKGKYTSLCMFWTAADIFKKRIKEGRTDEARKIFEALKGVLPYIKDNDPAPADGGNGQAKSNSDGIPSLGIDRPERSTTQTVAAFMQYASRTLGKYRKAGTAKTPRDQKREKEIDAIRAIREIRVQNKETETDPIRAIREIRVQKISVPKEDIVEPFDDDLSGHLVVGLDEGIIRQPERLNIPQLKVLQYITIHQGTSVSKISEDLNIPSKSVERHIAALSAQNLIEHRGSKKTGGYYTPVRE